MKIISVHAERNYTVSTECNWRDELIKIATGRVRMAVIHSMAMAEAVQISDEIDTEIFYFSIPDAEAAKNLATVSKLWDWLGAAGFTRSDLIVGVGGGAITDVAGFAAASWLRGIDWVAVPTSVAGMVDASIGGKTGINSEYGKNLIGAFHSPIHVLVDFSWLTTLSDRDFCAGMAEVIKCGFIADGGIIDLVHNRAISDLRKDFTTVATLIDSAIAIKAKVVSLDFKESFAREVLNYGHTLGHAIEIHSAFGLRHGEAVSIGMVFAAELAQVKGLLPVEIVEMHRIVLSGLNLPITYPRAAWPELLPLLALDKKTRGTSLRFVAISAIGETLRIEAPLESELRTAYERICS